MNFIPAMTCSLRNPFIVTYTSALNVYKSNLMIVQRASVSSVLPYQHVFAHSTSHQ